MNEVSQNTRGVWAKVLRKATVYISKPNSNILKKHKEGIRETHLRISRLMCKTHCMTLEHFWLSILYLLNDNIIPLAEIK